MATFDFSHQPLLGTFVSVSSTGVEVDEARAIDRAVVDEIVRLEAMLSRYRNDSAFERWKRDELSLVPQELSAVLGRATYWSLVTHGALDPRGGALTQLWRDAAQRGSRPDPADIDALLRRLDEPSFTFDDDGAARRLGDCSTLDLHAFAKGWIVDRALEVARAVVPGSPGAAVVVNAGGDIARLGDGTTSVSIEDPFRPYDNAAPLDRVRIGSGGVATSGNSHRGIDVDGHRYSHIIDTRTGEPANGAVSVSVIAGSAEAADAWATALMLAAPDDVVAMGDEAEISVMAVRSDRSVLANEGWQGCRLEG